MIRKNICWVLLVLVVNFSGLYAGSSFDELKQTIERLEKRVAELEKAAQPASRNARRSRKNMPVQPARKHSCPASCKCGPDCACSDPCTC